MKSEARIISAFLGVLCIFVTVVFIGIGPANVFNFWDAPSFVFVLFPPISGALIVSGIERSIKAFRCALNRRAGSADERVEAIRLWQLLEMLSYASGVLGTMVGLINMFSGGMDDMGAMTAGMAVALLTILYSVMQGMLCRMMATRALLATIPESASPLGAQASDGFLQPQEAIAQPPLSSAEKFQYLYILLIVAVLSGFILIVASLDKRNNCADCGVLPIPAPTAAFPELPEATGSAQPDLLLPPPPPYAP